ncbi:MAG: metallophosphoesterase family protein [Pseudomonadota bacterium]
MLHDIGELTGDVLIYGGPYSNLQATEALFDLADARGIAVGNRICTGDVVAYCADPAAAWEAVLARGGHIVAGNCERQIAEGAEGCGCGFEDGTACDLMSRGWYPRAAQAFAGDAAARAAMGALPDVIVFAHQGRRCAVIHGGVTDIARFVWPVSDVAVFEAEIQALEAVAGPVDMVFAGHAGVPFQRQVGDLLWVNAGVIGMPPHDGAPDTRVVVLGEAGLVVERLSYDWRAAQAAMEAAGLPQGYHAALESGWWPSEEVLPVEMRRNPPPQSPSRREGEAAAR